MKKQHQNQVFSPLQSQKVWLMVVTGLVLFGLSFGYGYFWGRYEQIQVNKSVLKPIPDVNCSQEAH